MLGFSPLLSMIAGEQSPAVTFFGQVSKAVDRGTFALAGNLIVFAAVSALTKTKRGEKPGAAPEEEPEESAPREDQ
ncbi:MAG: hypothetical protein R3F11_27385 [Verrucomicrobiales bacterium]